jgi:hypothetical protein
MKFRSLLHFALALAVLLASAPLYARGISNGENSKMIWQDSMESALAAAQKEKAPVMAVIFQPGLMEQQRAVSKLDLSPDVVSLSHTFLKAVKITDPEEGKALTERVYLKTLPALVWIDPCGNPIMGEPLTNSVKPIVEAAANWQDTLACVEKYFKNHIAQGEKLITKSKLREAYVALAAVSSYKGPLPEKAKSLLESIKEKWLKLADMAQTLPKGSPGRKAVVNGVRAEVANLDCAAAILEAFDRAAPVAKPAAPAGESATVESKPAAPPAHPAPPASVAAKSLVQAAAAAMATPAVTEKKEETSINTSLLQSAKDERLKNAGKLIQEGVAAYNQGANMDGGAQRNTTLQGAHDKFEAALKLLEDATGDKGDAATEKLMEKVSMLEYCCLKYTTL